MANRWVFAAAVCCRGCACTDKVQHTALSIDPAASVSSAPITDVFILVIPVVIRPDVVVVSQILSGGNAWPAGTNASAIPLLHHRCPVGFGPSSNTWP